MNRHVATTVCILALGMGCECSAALVVNAAMPITKTLTVQPIIAQDDSGNNPATFMGTPTQEGMIKTLIDTIWSQAGIDIVWNTPNTINSSYTLNGGITTMGPTRPDTDLSTGSMSHEALGDSAGVTVRPNAVNIFFVDVAAGFPLLSSNFAAGSAETPGDDISQYVGSDLPGFTSGHEVIASVIAHEIGHTLSLTHLDVAEGLMRPGDSMLADGQRLSAAEVNKALMSGMNTGILQAIPEPNAFLLLGLVGVVISGARCFRLSKKTS